MPLSREAERPKSDHGLRRQRIVQSILADVFEGRLRAGRHLVTQHLAERFSVSHTPIREALIALAGIGIVDLLPNKGAVVRKVTAKDVREFWQGGRALECRARRTAWGRVDLAELHPTADDLKKLRAFKPSAAARFIARARVVDTRLHDFIAPWCGNAFLANELTRLKTLFR